MGEAEAKPHEQSRADWPARYLSGEPLTVLMREAGIDRESVWRWLMGHGVRRERRPRPPKDWRAVYLRAYPDGDPRQEWMKRQLDLWRYGPRS